MAYAPKTYEIDVEDVEYVRHGEKPLLARLYKPRGAGPFPAMVEIHGGAWNLGERTMAFGAVFDVPKLGLPSQLEEPWHQRRGDFRQR